MDLQGRNLKLQSRGDDVRLLHTELRKLDYKIPDREYSQRYFDTATQKAVKHFQEKHELPSTGVVDKKTAKRINQAVDALKPASTSFVVKGHIRLKNQSPVPGVVVKAYVKDLRSEELLGETATDNQGVYEIKYPAKQFPRAEKKRTNLIVRVYAEEDVVLGQSDVIFNSQKAETIDLVVRKPAIPKLSEYELLVRVIAPVLDGLTPAELTDQDIEYLLKELTGEQVANKLRLNFLAQSARLARDTKLPVEFFYGMARQLQLKPPLTPDPFLGLTPSAAGQALKNAIQRNIIPARLRESVNTMLGRLEQLKLERKVLVEHQLAGCLLNEETGKPLFAFRVRVSHQHGDEKPKDLGVDITDRAGRFSFAIITLPSATEEAPDRPTDHLSISILNPKNEEIHKAEFEIKPDQTELPDVKVPAQTLPKPPVRPVKDVAASLQLKIPERLASFLAERKIHSIEDIRRVGGLRRVKDLPVAADHPAIKVLEDQANLSVLKSSVEENARLVEKGFPNIGAIATTPRKSFHAAVGKELGTRKTMQVHATARAQQHLLGSVLAGIGADTASRQVPMIWQGETGAVESEENPITSEVQEMFANACSCRDCEAAVSPAAYLTDLLDYAVEHVQGGSFEGEFITLEELANLLSQPFGDLPVSCEAVTKQIRQVRLCTEVLRRRVQGVPLPDAEETSYRFAAYTSLLSELGTSHEELRLARTADDDTRGALAERLGINLSGKRPDELDELLPEPESLTEAWLEEKFGLVDTTRDPLSGGLTRGDDDHQVTRWQLDGVEWNWNTDSGGVIFARLSHPSGLIYQVDLYRDDASAQLVATGQMIISARGTVRLSPRNYSDLSGTIELDFSRESDDIELVTVPEFLCWRLSHLRSLWTAHDGIADPYTQDPVAHYTEADLLPVIDPDLICPDDFRTPFAKANETDHDGPFDLWIERRKWTDDRRYDLQQLQQRLRKERRPDAEALTEILKNPYPVVELPLAWPASPRRITGVLPVLATLGEKLARGQDPEDTKQQIWSGFRLTVESFTRLREIQAKAEEQKLLDEDWEEVFSILTQAEKRRWFPTWRAEERRVEGRLGHELFGPRYFWTSLLEPLEGLWPPETAEDRPLIDPELVALADLPEPTAGQRAIILWRARRANLDEAFNELKTEHETEGFAALLTAAFGDHPTGEAWEAHLTGLLDRARRAEASGLEEDLDAVQLELEDLGLATMENLSRLMKIQGAEDASESEWDEVYTLLTSCRKQREGWPSRWCEEEQADPVLEGRYWLARKARLPKWQASAADRATWQQALRSRSRAPIIDPDLISLEHLRNMAPGPAYNLRRDRRQWIEEQFSDLQTKRDAASTPFAAFESMLIDSLFDPDSLLGIESQCRDIREASGLNDLLKQTVGHERDALEALLTDLDSSDAETSHNAVQAVIQSLFFSVDGFRRLMRLISGTVTESEWQQVYTTLARATLVASVMALDLEREQGKDIAGRLAQLGLTNAAFSYLVRIRNLLAGDATIQDSEWDDICSIFIQVLKNRASADWKQDEQEQAINLSPDHFKIPEPPPLQFPPPEPEPLTAWRADERDLRQWRNTLKSRIEQGKTVISAMHDAVGAVEEETLPGLRNALIMATDIEESDLASKAKRLTDMLLIDTQAGGCRQTTRISQAIESIQGLLWSLRTGQLQDTYEDMILLADNFDEEWTWIGSYATWRAALFVFLYPENILLPSLRREQTPAFRKLVSDLRMNRRMTAEGACLAAKEYADYFEDVCTLKVQATCYGETRIHKNDRCGTRVSDEPTRNLFYMFATGGKTGRIYWSALDPEDELGYPQTFWEAVPGHEDVQVTKIVGSVPYRKSDEQRFIFLFLLVEEGGETKLLFTKYDLERGEWDSERGELDPPSDSTYRSAIAVQFQDKDEQPLLLLNTSIGLFLRALSSDGTGWSEIESSPPEESSSNDDWVIYKIGISHRLVGELSLAVPFSSEDKYLVFHTDPHNVAVLSVIQRDFDNNFILTGAGNYELNVDAWIGALTELGAEDMLVFYTYQGSFYCSRLVREIVEEPMVIFTAWRTTHTTILHSGVNKLVLFYGRLPIVDHVLGIVEKLHLVFRSGSRYNLVGCEWMEGGLQQVSLMRIIPQCPPEESEGLLIAYLTSPFDIRERFSEGELQNRRAFIRRIFQDNLCEDASPSILTYLEEAYYFVPVHLALQLQRHGDYTAALDWFRTVYDYRALPDRRKISYVLEREDDLSRDYERETDWLLDPLNPHEIAANRRKTYTRFTLLSLVRCFLEYADAEFSFDTAETVPRARTLYTTALELLGERSLKQRISSTCEELIGKLNIGVSDSIPADEIEYRWLWNGIQHSLYGINNAETLESTVDDIRRMMAEDESLGNRLNHALEAVNEVGAQAPRPMNNVIADRKEKLERSRELLLSRSWITDAAVEIGSTVERRGP